jgi:hypothetical protein
MALQNSEMEDHRNPLKVAEKSGWVGRKEDVILFEKIQQDCCLFLYKLFIAACPIPGNITCFALLNPRFT